MAESDVGTAVNYMHPVPKAAYLSGLSGSILVPLALQSDVLTTRPLRPVSQFIRVPTVTVF